MTLDELGPFDSVLDVGGNVGDFAELACQLWPQARVSSFEPLPFLAAASQERAAGRWWVEPVAISDTRGWASLHRCRNQHSASTLQEPGTIRAERFRIVDEWEDVRVRTRLLDDYADRVRGRCLVKIDVEGHERQVLAGGGLALSAASVAIVEVQQHPDIFKLAPSPGEVNRYLRTCSLYFAGVLDAFKDPGGEVLQFDGVWRR